MTHRTLAAGLMLLALVALNACNKDSTTDETPRITGLSINEPLTFVAVGTTLTFNADVSALEVSDGTSPVIGVYWMMNDEPRDTTTRNITVENPPFVYTAAEEGSYSLSCYAYGGTGYYSSTASTAFFAVFADTVVKGLAGEPDVTLGGQSYRTLTAGGKTWLGNNLYLTTSDLTPEGLSYRGAPILDQGAGRLYNWEEANAICPAGWHLPTVAEFQASFAGPDGKISAGSLMVDATFRDETMWEYCPDVNISNSFGFNAIPAGYVNDMNKFTPFETYGQYAAFWTADQKDDLGTFLYIYRENPVMQKASADKKTLYLSVRCVKD